jgi:CDP-2,3-bis-(O-geranylgeranyl)-sn-glycerol synthase
MIWLLIIQALWFFLPASFANMTPPLAGKISFVQRHNLRIDFGRNFFGQPLLGSGKTWLGLLLGTFIGTTTGFLQSFASIPWLPHQTWQLGLLLGLGALVGDICGAFIKRRLRMPRGAPAPGLDQLDFVLGAFAFSSLLAKINWLNFFVCVLIIPVLHLLINILGWKLKFKREPW